MDMQRSGVSTTLVDLRPESAAAAAARWGFTVTAADLSSPAAIQAAIQDADIVLGALPSRLGDMAMGAVIASGKPYVDIAFVADDLRHHHAAAAAAGVPVVFDCGVAPGVSNLLCGVALNRMERCDRLEILVGGLPQARHWPFEYKAPFAPWDVLEEYTRIARVVEGGKLVEKVALTEPELFDFEGIGTLEAVNTDGLRSLVDLPVPDMVEKTLRYPGHYELMRVFRETGLFDLEPVDVNGTPVVPREFMAKLLFPKWTYEEGEGDLTVMRIRAEGVVDGRSVRWDWDLVDRYDPQTGIRSMSRTTGFTATVVALRFLAGHAPAPGVVAPEALWEDADAILAALGERGVDYRFIETAQ
jgi:saccharopine dehydrogenase-like NADP-dependent oxidoreductase